MIVVATAEEYALAKRRFKHRLIVKTGVGGTNTVRKLKNYPRFIKITNFGYAGSNCIPVGTEVTIGRCSLYHPNVKYNEPEFRLNGETDCYTSTDFVLSTDIKKPCVFDMELAYICSLGFRKVESIKIVSDNLSMSEYEESIKDG